MHEIQASLHPDENAPVVNPNIYGHFAEHLGRGIYEGLWVGLDSEIPNRKGLRKDVVDALKELCIPVLRWPGGCFADEYHWKDGVGPRESRKRVYNTHWGGVVENNHFGTHEFFELCEQLGCKTYICGNVGSGAVQEMSEWVEYMTSPSESPMADWRRQNGRQDPWKIDYFGVGNESWGCGGHMRPEYYADEYRRYNTFVRTYGPNPIERIACGANATDYKWTEVLMERAHQHMNGLSLHNYTLLDEKWPPSGSSTEFSEQEWFSILKAAVAMDDLIVKHSTVMDQFDAERRVGLVVDEWGTWYPEEPATVRGFLFQQNTLRDALVAALHFHIFHRHSARVTMANIAQMVNVLQAMVLTEGPGMLRTPTYWVFEIFKLHQGGRLVPIHLKGPEVHGLPAASVSVTEKDGSYTLTAVNIDPNDGATIAIDLKARLVSKARILTAAQMNSHNTFDQPNHVQPVEFVGYSLSESKLHLNLPSKSIVAVDLTF